MLSGEALVCALSPYKGLLHLAPLLSYGFAVQCCHGDRLRNAIQRLAHKPAVQGVRMYWKAAEGITSFAAYHHVFGGGGGAASFTRVAINVSFSTRPAPVYNPRPRLGFGQNS